MQDWGTVGDVVRKQRLLAALDTPSASAELAAHILRCSMAHAVVHPPALEEEAETVQRSAAPVVKAMVRCCRVQARTDASSPDIVELARSFEAHVVRALPNSGVRLHTAVELFFACCHNETIRLKDIVDLTSAAPALTRPGPLLLALCYELEVLLDRRAPGLMRILRAAHTQLCGGAEWSPSQCPTCFRFARGWLSQLFPGGGSSCQENAWRALLLVGWAPVVEAGAEMLAAVYPALDIARLGAEPETAEWLSALAQLEHAPALSPDLDVLLQGATRAAIEGRGGLRPVERLRLEQHAMERL